MRSPYRKALSAAARVATLLSIVVPPLLLAPLLFVRFDMATFLFFFRRVRRAPRVVGKLVATIAGRPQNRRLPGGAGPPPGVDRRHRRRRPRSPDGGAPIGLPFEVYAHIATDIDTFHNGGGAGEVRPEMAGR